MLSKVGENGPMLTLDSRFVIQGKDGEIDCSCYDSENAFHSFSLFISTVPNNCDLFNL